MIGGLIALIICALPMVIIYAIIGHFQTRGDKIKDTGVVSAEADTLLKSIKEKSHKENRHGQQ